MFGSIVSRTLHYKTFYAGSELKLSTEAPGNKSLKNSFFNKLVSLCVQRDIYALPSFLYFLPPLILFQTLNSPGAENPGCCQDVIPKKEISEGDTLFATRSKSKGGLPSSYHMAHDLKAVSQAAGTAAVSSPFPPSDLIL